MSNDPNCLYTHSPTIPSKALILQYNSFSDQQKITTYGSKIKTIS